MIILIFNLSYINLIYLMEYLLELYRVDRGRCRSRWSKVGRLRGRSRSGLLRGLEEGLKGNI